MSKFSGILAQARNRQSDDDNIMETEAETSPSVQGESKKTASIPIENLAPVPEKQFTPKTKGSRILKATPQQETQKLPAPVITPTNTEPLVRRGRPNGKRTDPNYTQITAYITKQTHRDIKVTLIEQGNGQEISEVIEECLRDWLHRNK